MVPSAYYETFCHFTKLSEDWYMMYETTNHFTELTMSFVAKLRNPVKSAELKKDLKENHETIYAPRNLKSFGAKMRNF